MSTTTAGPFSTADGNRSIQPQGCSQGQLEAISPLEIKNAQVSTAAASEAARRPQRPPDQAGQRPESSARATSSKRAHPEGNYFVNKDAPREAFLRRKLARSIEVHHDNSERISAVRASYSADEIRPPPVFPRAIEMAVAEDLVEPREEPTARAHKFAFKDSLISSVIPQLPIPAPPTRQLAAARTRPSTPVPLSEPDDGDFLDEPCASCEAEEGKPDSIDNKEIGDIRYSQMGGKDELRMIPVLDMRRPSIFSNPFSMGKDENKRDLVCDAYQEWWRRRTVTVDEICAHFGATRAQTWHGDEIAASEERIRGLSQLARIVSKGHKIAAGCACPATKRCHTQVVRSMVLEEARLLYSRESVAEPVKQVVNDKYLVLFAGDNSVAGRLSEQIRLKDSDALVEEYDVRNDSHQDLSDVELQLKILGRILDGEFKAVHIAPPIGSYAVVDGPSDSLESRATRPVRSLGQAQRLPPQTQPPLCFCRSGSVNGG
jgi:hypothetical protein